LVIAAASLIDPPSGRRGPARVLPTAKSPRNILIITNDEHGASDDPNHIRFSHAPTFGAEKRYSFSTADFIKKNMRMYKKLHGAAVMEELKTKTNDHEAIYCGEYAAMVILLLLYLHERSESPIHFVIVASSDVKVEMNRRINTTKKSATPPYRRKATSRVHFPSTPSKFTFSSVDRWRDLDPFKFDAVYFRSLDVYSSLAPLAQIKSTWQVMLGEITVPAPDHSPIDQSVPPARHDEMLEYKNETAKKFGALMLPQKWFEVDSADSLMSDDQRFNLFHSQITAFMSTQADGQYVLKGAFGRCKKRVHFVDIKSGDSDKLREAIRSLVGPGDRQTAIGIQPFVASMSKKEWRVFLEAKGSIECAELRFRQAFMVQTQFDADDSLVSEVAATLDLESNAVFDLVQRMMRIIPEVAASQPAGAASSPSPSSSPPMLQLHPRTPPTHADHLVVAQTMQSFIDAGIYHIRVDCGIVNGGANNSPPYAFFNEFSAGMGVFTETHGQGYIWGIAEEMGDHILRKLLK